MNRKCGKCRLIKLEEDFGKSSSSSTGFQNWCKLCNRNFSTEYTRRVVEELKQKVFEKLGQVCVRCGFSDKRALQIDHVKGDGFETRHLSQVDKLKLVLADESDSHQILCANCNWIKRHENREHMKSSNLTESKHRVLTP